MNDYHCQTTLAAHADPTLLWTILILWGFFGVIGGVTLWNENNPSPSWRQRLALLIVCGPALWAALIIINLIALAYKGYEKLA